MSGFILCPVSGEYLSQSICDYGVYVSNSAKLPLRFVNIVEHSSHSKELDISGNIKLGERDDLLEKLSLEEEELSKATIKEGKELLKSLEQKAKEQSTSQVSITQIHGEVVESLIELKNDIQLLVVGLCGNCEHKIGENIKELIREIHKPVLLVSNNFQTPKKILIAYNGSRESKEILKIITSHPLFGEVQRTIVNNNTNPELSQKLLQEAKEIFEKNNISVETLSLNLSQDALLKYFEEADFDILAMGAYSHSRLKEFVFGSFTSKVLENITKPILLFR